MSFAERNLSAAEGVRGEKEQDMRHPQRLTDEQVEQLAQRLKTHHLGPENATTHPVLGRALHLTDLGSAGRPRIPGSSALTDGILRARRNGHPIACDPQHGLFYARYREDANDSLEHYTRCERRYRLHRSSLAFAASKLASRHSIEETRRIAQ